MMRYQVGFVLEEEEIESIVKFLKTLTGDIPKLIEEDKWENQFLHPLAWFY